MSEHDRNLRDGAERIDRLNGPIWASRFRAAADYIEQLEVQVQVTQRRLESFQAENAALREKLRLADEMWAAVGAVHGSDDLHDPNCVTLRGDGQACDCGIQDLHDADAAYEAGRRGQSDE